MKNNASPNDLLVFLAVLNEGGFRAAAKRLDIAPSLVSTTVARLEAQLGVPLLLRTTRSMRATQPGQALAVRIAPLLRELDAACEETAGASDQIQGRLKLNVPGAVVPDILPPIVVEFQRRHPRVELEIVVENILVDIVAAGCDAGIGYGASLEKDMISIALGPRVQQIALAASPRYLAAHGKPETPEQLAGHDAIRYKLPGGPVLPWRLHKAGTTVVVGPVTRLALSVNVMDSGLVYARAGLGLIATFRNWLEADFSAGTLLPILPEWWAELEGPRLYYPSRFTSTPLRALIDMCRAMAAA